MKKLLTAFVAVLALFLVGFVAAGSLASIDSVTFNDVELANGATDIAGFAGDVVPVRVTFTANVDSSDVKIRTEIYGGREDYVDTTGRFNVIDGHVYTKLLSVRLPNDLKNVAEDLTLEVKIFDAEHDNDNVIAEYVVRMQRESYEFEIVSVDYDLTVDAGDNVPVAVVVKNLGYERAEDGFVTVTIPGLGVSAKGYFGDLVADEDVCTDCDDDEDDSVYKILNLRIPESAAAGVYELVVKAYNADSVTSVSRDIKVSGLASTNVLASVKNQNVNAGETKTYELIIVNSADDVKVYNLDASSGDALSVSVPSVVTVGPQSSEKVSVQVKVADNAEVGAYAFVVSVNGQQVVFGANVTDEGASTSVVALTVVLVIVFVVLLIILIVLLTRRDSESKSTEEVETSYY